MRERQLYKDKEDLGIQESSPGQALAPSLLLDKLAVKMN